MRITKTRWNGRCLIPSNSRQNLSFLSEKKYPNIVVKKHTQSHKWYSEQSILTKHSSNVANCFMTQILFCYNNIGIKMLRSFHFLFNLHKSILAFEKCKWKFFHKFVTKPSTIFSPKNRFYFCPCVLLNTVFHAVGNGVCRTWKFPLILSNDLANHKSGFDTFVHAFGSLIVLQNYFWFVY